MSKKFKNKIRNAKNPYFKKNTSLNIKKIIEKVIAKNNIEKKCFMTFNKNSNKIISYKNCLTKLDGNTIKNLKGGIN